MGHKYFFERIPWSSWSWWTFGICFRVRIEYNGKRDAENPIFYTLSTTTFYIFSACNKPTAICLQSFIIIIQSLGCMEILISLYHAKKIADEVLLDVFNTVFPASMVKFKMSHFMVSSKGRIKSHTSFEEPLMSVLSISYQFK